MLFSFTQLRIMLRIIRLLTNFNELLLFLVIYLVEMKNVPTKEECKLSKFKFLQHKLLNILLYVSVSTLNYIMFCRCYNKDS